MFALSTFRAHFAAAMGLVLLTAGLAAGSPYVAEVVSYTAGSNAVAGYDNPATALGKPSTVTGTGAGVKDVTVFNPAFLKDQIVSIGAGGSLVLKFDHKVWDNTDGDVWGIDFLVFGNAMYINQSGKAGNCASEPARIQVSQDGLAWHEVSGVFADSAFPTMGFLDSSGPYVNDGTIESDFLKPVNPAFVATGKTLAEIQAGYAGSGGGTGVDFHSTGLGWIQYVRIYQDASDTWSAEIDALADVAPEPAAMLMLLAGSAAVLARRCRKS